MTNTLKSFAFCLLITMTSGLAGTGFSDAQIPLPVYVVPSPMVTVRKPVFHRHGHHANVRYAAVVPFQAAVPAFYAPQVPLEPMAFGPVPTMSAYYVPTAPVMQTYYAPVKTHHRVRHQSVPVVPVAIYPQYWIPEWNHPYPQY